MKVLMIEQMLPENTYSQELCCCLEQYADVTLATTRYYQPGQEQFQSVRVFETRIKKGFKELAMYFRGVLWLYGAAIFGKYDVIHVQTFKRWAVEKHAVVLARKMTRKKLVYTAHNVLPHEHNANQKEEEALRKWYRLCDAIIVHNEQSKQILVDFCPDVADKVYVIAHGTFSAFSSFVKEVPHQKTVFLQFGQLRKYKGVAQLLRAASLIPEEYRKKIKIVIAGKQWKNLDDTDYDAMLDQYHLRDFVELNNDWIPDEKMPDYFNSADCCLFPYTNIYGSGAMLMAYTFNKPVIASGIPAFVEETDNGNTGLLYDPDDDGALAKAIQTFTELPQENKESYKNRIRDLCENKYNWAVSAASLADIYQKLIQ